MTTFPDISEWYTPERIDAEEPLWSAGPYHDNAQRVTDVCSRYNLSSVIEAGCGTGWIPTALSPSLGYIGIDNNPHMLFRARDKNPSRVFIQSDIRLLKPSLISADLVCSFAVLKHFSLTEWSSVLSAILSIGQYGLFTQHVLLDDRPAMEVGTEFHHIWPTKPELMQAIASANHEVLDLDYSAMDHGIGAPEAYVTTKRKS